MKAVVIEHLPPAPAGATPIASAGVTRPARDVRALVVAYTAAVFTSALLLFAIQPMFAKMVLPLLGGSPAVWNTAMLFFQAMLLGGYLYAHVATARLGVRRQAALHLLLLTFSLAALPIGVAAGWTPPTGSSPIPWLLLLFTVSIGIPFLLLSASAPMLQKWFSRTDHPARGNPYFLYAASNLGSMAALLSYPVIVEPRLLLVEQSAAWSATYGLFVLLVAACALLLWRSGSARRAGAEERTSGAVAEPEREVEEAPSARDRASWTVLALVPSSLLLGVTTFLTTDIAAVPLLWIVPLALYLLTFVIVFSTRPAVTHEFAIRLVPFVIVPVVVTSFWRMGGGSPALLPLHLLGFFVLALVCHGELAARRPPARWLTEFYLWIAVGGVLGGVFNVIAAPLVFRTVVEYPLAIVLACALIQLTASAGALRSSSWRDLAYPVVLFLIIAAALLAWKHGLREVTRTEYIIVTCLAGATCFLFRRRPMRFALGVAAVLLASGTLGIEWRGVLLVERSFFGVNTVLRTADGGHHLLTHGTTLHGAQSLAADSRLDPLTYYHRDSPIGQLFTRTTRPAAGGWRVAAVGLGTGSIACYARPGEHWTFYEIDPVVVRIARNPEYFSFVSDCAPDAAMVLGDARLTLTEAPPASFDLIVLDAFSSDAIPVHLVTREALALYLDKLAPGGRIAFHISNRHLDLQPVLAALAHDAELAALYRSAGVSAAEAAEQKSASAWMVMGRRLADLAPLSDEPGWSTPVQRSDLRLWTDDYSNIFQVIRWR